MGVPIAFATTPPPRDRYEFVVVLRFMFPFVRMGVVVEANFLLRFRVFLDKSVPRLRQFGILVLNIGGVFALDFGGVTAAVAVAAVAAVFHLDVVVGLCSNILEAFGRFHEQFSESPVEHGGRIVQKFERWEGAQTGGILPSSTELVKTKSTPTP